MGLNMILSLIGAIGIALIVMGLLSNLFTQSQSQSNLDLLEYTDQGTGGAPQKPQQISLEDRIKTLLYQARAPISPSEFITVSLSIGGVFGVAIFLTTGGILTGLFMFIAGSAMYYVYLVGKRDKMFIEYEKEQPQILFMLINHFGLHGIDLVGALKYVASDGPAIVRDDWEQLAAAFDSPTVNMAVIRELVNYRNSASLTRVIEAFLNYRGPKIEELPGILAKLRKSVSRDVKIARENMTMVYNARSNLRIIALMPVVLSIFIMLTTPFIRDFYGTMMGQIIILSCWAVAGGAYYWGERKATDATMTRSYTVRFQEQRDGFAFTGAVASQDALLYTDHSVASPIHPVEAAGNVTESESIRRPLSTELLQDQATPDQSARTPVQTELEPGMEDGEDTGDQDNGESDVDLKWDFT